MFEFINAIVVLCNLPSVFVDGEEVLGANAVCGMFSFDDNDGNDNDNGVSGGELWSQKKPVSFSWGNNCLPRFSENSNSTATAITKLTQLLTSMLLIPTYAFCQKYLDIN